MASSIQESFSSSSSEDEEDLEDDALSLAESLNLPDLGSPKRPVDLPSNQPEPPVPPIPSQENLRLQRVLGAATGSHLVGAGRERFLLCGAGAVWTLGREASDAPRFLPAGIQSSGGPLAAPVLAAACGPGGLIVLAHEAVTPGARRRPALSVWSAPALGLQTPSCVAALTCDKEVRGGASAVGFAGGPGTPFIWVAEKPCRGAAVHAFDWRRHQATHTRDDAAKVHPGGHGAEFVRTTPAASVSWVPGGPGRRLAAVVSDGGAQDIAACGSSFLCFLSLQRPEEGIGVHGPTDASTDARTRPLEDGTMAAPDEPHLLIKPKWDPSEFSWDSNTKVPPAYAIGMGSQKGGAYTWGGGFHDDVQATRRRNAMPAASDEARVHGGPDDAPDPGIIPTITKATFANHGQAGSLRPLSCLAFEPATGGAQARGLAGGQDGWVLRLGRGRRVQAAWHAHNAAVTAVCFAGGGVFAAATAGADGQLKLWVLSKAPPDSGNVKGGGVSGVATYAQQLVGQWDLKGAGLGAPGLPRQCLASMPSRLGLPADFDLVMLAGYGVHQVSVHRPRRDSTEAVAERWLFGPDPAAEDEEDAKDQIF